MSFNSQVHRAGVAINGFQLKFSDGDRWHWEQSINFEETNMQISGDTVSFPVSLRLRGSSGHIDNRYEGWADVR